MRRVACVLLLVAAACSATVAAPAPVSAQAGPVGSPVVFRPRPGTTLRIEGLGPFHGIVEIRREGGGLTIVNELDLDRYVEGVREVPGMWPMEALKAQAVAARTYALWEKERGYWTRFGFDVCGTVSCQVYQGAAAGLGERGRRWTAAVRDTAGEVLLHRGEPALTRYHSSSGGRTLANEVVYPSAGPRPYLRAVDDPFDKVSPLHRWEVSFSREALQRILAHAIDLAGTITHVIADERERRLVIRTEGGELEMSTVRFRREVSESAPIVFPGTYPGLRDDGQRMPETIPSSRFVVRKTGDGFLVQGKGYGHGVGMSQYGAMGRASDGHSYDKILAHYYSGLRPTVREQRGPIRVAVVRGTDAVRVSGDGPFGVFTGGRALAGSTVGGWSVAPSGERSMSVSPPQGHALPLVLTGVDAPQEQFVDPPERGGRLEVNFVVPKAVQVTGVLERGDEVVTRSKTVVEAGERRLSIDLPVDKLARRASYRLRVQAFDGTDAVDHTVEVVLVRPATSIVPRAAFAAVVMVMLFLIWRRGRRALRAA